MFNFFFRKRKPLRPLLTDLHSHLLPGIDDGVKTSQESFDIIQLLLDSGYKKIITTPHIMTDYYGNSVGSIRDAYNQFLPELKEKEYSIQFECAAEYYFDEKVFGQVTQKEELLTFGEKYFLFETNAVSEPLQLKEFIFSLTSQGYRPILAHPERYQYMNIAKAEDFRDRGVLLQINMLSLIGFYGPTIQKMASQLIDRGLIDALGSDFHNMNQAVLLEKILRSKLYSRALELPLLNYVL